MQIEPREITVAELSKAYKDEGENGVFGYDSKLNIRPPYQREFVYKDKQREAVIHTVKRNYPLNVMYWANNSNDEYEVIDGQQRTISICQYVNGDFAYEMMYFHNLTESEKNDVLNYKLMVYVCTGTDKEKLEWFKTINIAGEKLTEQELRNAVYSGSWVSDAKRYFSKTGCVASQIGSDYLNGSPIRQDYIETAIEWIARSDMTKYKGNIESYMAQHQHDVNALALWQYFQQVITWVKNTFTNHSNSRLRLMKGQDWGGLYNKYKDTMFDPKQLENRIVELIDDDEVESKKGIYPYLLTGQEKYLNLRAFTPKDIQKMYQRQNGICPMCKEHFELSQMDADHITPWSKGGKTNLDNGQMLCRPCNMQKSAS